MKIARSIRGRMGLMSGTLVLGITLLSGIFIYVSFRAQLLQSLDEELRLDAEQLLISLTSQPDEATAVFQSDAIRLRSEETSVRLLAGDGTLLSQRGSGVLPPVTLSALPTTTLLQTVSIQEVESGDPSVETDDLEPYRLLTTPIRRDGVITGYLQIGRELETIAETLNGLVILLALAGSLLIVFAGFGGYWLAGRALAPIEAIRSQAASLSAQDLSRRLDLDLPDDEVGRLARTFDDMLARLEAGFQRQRRFAADASHELRTPLSIIQGEVEVTLDQTRSPEAYQASLRTIGAESVRMARLVSDLLLLARGEADQLHLERENLDLSALLQAVVAASEFSASEADVVIDLALSNAIFVSGDRDRLTQLFLNLIQNALIHAPGSRLTISAKQNREMVTVAVSDDGPGIAPHELPHVFEPFYRTDPSRSRRGVGLGLSICREIVAAHGGAIVAESRQGDGTTFRIELPITRGTSDIG